jgi:hypothetical protein
MLRFERKEAAGGLRSSFLAVRDRMKAQSRARTRATPSGNESRDIACRDKQIRELCDVPSLVILKEAFADEMPPASRSQKTSA